MTNTSTGRSSYGAVEDPRARRFYGRHNTSCSSSRSTMNGSNTTNNSSNNNTTSTNTESKGEKNKPKPRPSDEESRSSNNNKRRAKFGAGIVIVLASMILGYVLGAKVASARDDNNVLDAAAAAAGAGDSLLAEREVDSMEEKKAPCRLLSLQARNEYGVFDALVLYGLDIVVEPHKATVLSVTGVTIARDGCGDIVAEEDRSGSGSEVQQLSTVSINDGGERRGSKRTQQVAEEEITRKKSFFRWVLTPLSEDGAPVPDAPPMLNVTLDGGGAGFASFAGGEGAGGAGVDGPAITLAEAGTVSLLKVTEFLEDGRVIGEGRATVSCRYVRRELRELTEKDREAFMDAMVQFYTAPTTVAAGEGLELHYQHFAEVHNADNFCYHNGMMFLTAHLAFDWAMERALQKINPAVSLAYWDYTIESGTLGANWPRSEVFGPRMFGSALGSADNGFIVADGRFANVSSIYDPDALLTSTGIEPVHNPYGYISAKFDYQDVETLSRTHSLCGFTGTSSFPRCEDIVDCFDENKSLQFWSECMEDNIHADMHGWLGGAWGCKADMGQFKAEHPEFSDGLLVFVLQFATASRWPINELFGDYNECDTSCTRGSQEPCGCRCLINPDNMTNDEVYTVMEDAMIAYTTLFNAADFIYRDLSNKYEYNFIQDGEPLKEEELFLLLRYIFTVGCEPANTGAMATGASPMDPLFWVLHPIFERALHVLWLSPEYRDTYDFSWVGSDCYGSGLTDQLPFTEHSLGQGPGTSFLTNEDIFRIAHPSNSKLPYVYSNFKTWGTCTDWNPCPQCTKEA